MDFVYVIIHRGNKGLLTIAIELFLTCPLGKIFTNGSMRSYIAVKVLAFGWILFSIAIDLFDVGCVNRSLRQYFRLHWAASREEKEKRDDSERKKSPNNTHPHLTQAQ